MRATITALCLALALQGCATSPSRTQIGAQALQSGNYSSAESYLRSAVQAGERPDVNWLHLGQLYAIQARQSLTPETRGILARQAQSAMLMAARYGNPTAQATLQAWGQPVPRADLARNGDDAAAVLLLAGAAIASRGTNAQPVIFAPSAPVHCLSTVQGAFVNTNCQ